MTTRRHGERLAEQLAQLRRLADDPAEQLALAARMVQTERNAELVLAALAVLGERPATVWRPLLRAAYDHYAQNGPRRDPGATVRTAILQALRPVANHEDITWLEEAVTTYEFALGEVAGGLRATALVVLDEVDATLAGYQAVRLLSDRHTSIMSGEPAVTAARLLAAQRQYLPLYGYVSQTEVEGQVGDVVGECLRGLVALPASLLPELIRHYSASRDEIVLLGLFDLLLNHPTRADHLPFLLAFLTATDLLNIYRYLVTTLVASGEPRLVEALTAMERSEPAHAKRAILEEALAVRRDQAAATRRPRRGGPA